MNEKISKNYNYTPPPSPEKLREEYNREMEKWDKMTKEEQAEYFRKRHEAQEKYFKNLTVKKVKEESLIISERAINYILGQFKIKGIEKISIEREEIDAEMMWIIDFLSREISNQWGFSNNKDSKELVLFNNPDIFFNFIDNTKIKPCIWELKLTASKIREKMNLSSDEMPIKKLINLFDKVSEVFFNIRSEPILFNPEKNEWSRISIKSTLFLLIKEEIGTISNRWKTKDCELRLRFSSEYPMGWLMIGNLSCGRSGRLTLPERAYKELSLYEQNLVRNTRLWKNSQTYLVLIWGKIAGYKQKNITLLTKYLDKAWENIKLKGYIKKYEIKGKGKKAIIEIIK